MFPAGVRLVPLGDLVDPMRARYGPLYDFVRVPAGAYPGAAGVATIGVPNFLLCRPDLPAATAQALVGLLLADAHALVPDEAAGTQFLDGRSLIATGDIPLHRGAVEAYRRWHG
jgi:TRAP-type uncharacterized transport system substrate-binding protein